MPIDRSHPGSESRMRSGPGECSRFPPCAVGAAAPCNPFTTYTLWMLFPDRPITLEQVRAFCAKFGEGYRIEYKASFDANVRDKTPKVLSSFANSHGGVLVVGVNAPSGIPRPPFEGFEPPPREELALTVENLCLQNIYPPILPRTTVVQSDKQDRVFLVVEIEESEEAPHAIENSKRVYVRTGNAGTPYDLADVDLIIDLVKRRKEPLELAERIARLSEERAHLNIPSIPLHAGSLKPRFLQVNIGPRFPRQALCSTHEVWDFVSSATYRGGRFFPGWHRPQGTRWRRGGESRARR
jgi:hypothetical protein